MYPPLLGKFIVPQAGHWSMPHEGWVTGVRYQPEPPLVVRGALNPWELERTREVFLTEEAAWKQIVPLQAEFRMKYAAFERAMAEYNRLIGEVDGVIGKKSGLESVTGITKMIPLPWFQVFNVFSGLVGGLFGGSSKKKKVDALLRQIEVQQAVMTRLQGALSALADWVGQLIQVGEGVRGGQAVRIDQAMAQSSEAYIARQALERMRGSILRERNRQVALMPRRTGGRDAL